MDALHGSYTILILVLSNVPLGVKHSAMQIQKVETLTLASRGWLPFCTRKLFTASRVASSSVTLICFPIL